MDGQKKEELKKYWYLIATIVFIILVFPFTIKMMNDAVLDNAQITGEELARNFAYSEEKNTKQYEVILNTLEYILRPSNRVEDTEGAVRGYMDFITDTMGFENVELYAVLDGEIRAAYPREEDSELKVSDRVWYQKAVAAGGDIIYTDVYKDVHTDQNVVTLSKQIRGTTDVAAMDIYLEQIGEMPESENMPEGSNFFLCDSKGQILYDYLSLEVEDLQGKFDYIFEAIQDGEHDGYDSYVTGVDGKKRGVYYYQMDSGWYSVMTIPYDSLLESSRTLWGIFLAVMSLFLAVMLVFVVLDYRSNSRARLYNKIVGVLGNTYYAFYMINLDQGKCIMLKGSEYVRSRIPRESPYDEFLETAAEVISKEDMPRFKKEFSLENMKKLMGERVRNFGGDYRRMFNGHYRWVHVQMLYDESLKPDSVVLCFRDVNTAKEEELGRMEFLRYSMQRADRMTKEKTVFVSQMSSDMEEPLQEIMKLSGEALQQPQNSAEVPEDLKKITALSSRMITFLSNIRDTSRIEDGRLEINSQRFSIREGLDELEEVCRTEALLQGKELAVEDEIRNRRVTGDWAKMRQILGSLLTEAFKGSKEGGKVLFRTGEKLENTGRDISYFFTVAAPLSAPSNTGSADGEEEKSRKMFRENGSPEMAAVYGIIRRMEGLIHVEQEENGSRVEVMIPCRICSGEAGEEEKEGS